MTIEVKNEYGKISVQEDLVSVVAGYAAVENYGIVGMCSKRTGDTLAERTAFLCPPLLPTARAT